MAESANQLVAELLTGTVKLLDIPDDLQASAERIYEDVGLWLGDHLDSDDEWDVFSQGSGRLGTAVRPSENDDFDLDAVARCNVPKDAITKVELKHCLGDALIGHVKAHADDDKVPSRYKEGRRCWTLFDDDLPFHMDFLPSVPDIEAPTSTGILLPDRDLFLWQRSDPIAYADWFHQRCHAEFVSMRAALAKSLHVNIEEVPTWLVKTALQRGVQVMKLHRNLFFADDTENRPPSILITTLAALAYRGQTDLFDAVMDMVTDMPSYIERDGSSYIVANPVQPAENFADRLTAAQAKKMVTWLGELERTLVEAADTRTGMGDMATRLSAGFGSTVTKAAENFGGTRRDARGSGRLAVTSTGAVTTGAGMGMRDHRFFGE